MSIEANNEANIHKYTQNYTNIHDKIKLVQQGSKFQQPSLSKKKQPTTKSSTPVEIPNYIIRCQT